jgi:hypothetical protein
MDPDDDLIGVILLFLIVFSILYLIWNCDILMYIFLFLWILYMIWIILVCIQ